MMYGAETWAVKKAQENNWDVAEMRMLMSGVTKLDRIGNKRIRGTTKVGEISKKVGWNGVGTFWEENNNSCIGKMVMVMEIPGEKKERKTTAEVVG